MSKRFTLHRDFETRSAVDLRKTGVYVYAMSPTTSPLCMAYAVNSAPVKLWLPGDPCPPEFIECANNPEWETVAHNDNFEATIETAIMSRRFGWPVVPLERHRCTMIQSLAMALPASLEMMAAALGMTERKDIDGRKIMLKVSKPRKIDKETGEITWWDHPELLEQLYAYCRNDVEVERQADKRLLALSPLEQTLWVLDQRINARGIFVDIKAVRRAIDLVESEKSRLDDEMHAVTNGAVSKLTQVAKLVEWAQRRGANIVGAAKSDVKEALEGENIPADVRRALEIRKAGAKASTAKLKAIELGTNADGRMRGTLQFDAATTHRWGGRRMQPQNLPRIETVRLPNGDPNQKAINEILEMMGDEAWDISPLD